MEELIKEIEQETECVCCMDKPKPNVTILGMCETGHMTCESCFRNISRTSEILTCPTCRSTTYKLVRGHKLASAFIKILTRHSTYKCKHEGCQQEVLGYLLDHHQKTCAEKPVACPKSPLCYFQLPVSRFLDGLHSRCCNISPRSEETKTWNIVWDMSTLYSFDSCNIEISDRFKPVILKGQSEGFVSHAYLTAMKKAETALVYIGWMNQKPHLEQKYQSLKFSISVYTFTPHGKVGQFVIKPPKFEDENTLINEDGVFLPKNTLHHWAEWSKNMKCPECHHSKGHPHLHIKISFSHDQIEF